MTQSFDAREALRRYLDRCWNEEEILDIDNLMLIIDRYTAMQMDR